MGVFVILLAHRGEGFADRVEERVSNLEVGVQVIPLWVSRYACSVMRAGELHAISRYGCLRYLFTLF